MKEGSKRDVTFFRWDDMPAELLSETFSRKLIIGDRLMLVHVIMKKGCVVPAHNHHNEQITHVLSGELKFHVDGREINVCAGEILLIPSNVVHAATALEDTVAIDTFSPPRQDFLDGTDGYLRGK